ncbi:ATPase associated with various cellular activities AAA_3 [Haladaptatus paucihalophilus DX253]|uniref:ATPase associated with various cellular activities AAA_3 n=1 Tax=Haladaptatus paucihalophilus DX253 TaxID=797209 RepID=E7QVM9_HALPU|nr:MULTISPECIES: MoxR family ATPase [Haladaptatus]EFW91292.1 ATPase associated with various cellular activities AAA_3 [Haladaptatus paucihalophilus DX253]GKZ14680.1 ATPase [Haladaptatus sp. T7]SHL09851.1 MoxR-like ATPase [Haladaptatus paucihalophilus DX253]
MTDAEALYDSILTEVSHVLIGKENLVEHLTVSLLTGGHVLLEGVPGIAKTMVANLFAGATGLSHSRIQMTPDLLPADITGTHVYREGTGEFTLQKGSIFANLVVADEINRATPKTQSAFLEAMEEEHVTINGETLSLPDPFMVIATQNPIDMEGTYQLPEAQRDRFQQKVVVDLPSADEEQELLDRIDVNPNLGPDDVAQVVTADAIDDARREVTEVHVAPEIKTYIRRLVEAVRTHEAVEYGGSPRASIAFLQTAKARAAIHGRSYVVPDDVKFHLRSVLIHRLVLDADAELRETTVADVLDSVEESIDPPGSTMDELVPTPDGGHQQGDDHQQTDDDHQDDA